MILVRSVKTKLFLVLLAITVIPAIIVALVTYKSYSSLISTQISEVSSNTLRNSVKRVNGILNTISNDSLTFAYQPAGVSNSVFKELIKYTTYVDDLNDWSFFTSSQNLQFFCETFLYSHTYINGVYIFTQGGNCLSYGNGKDIKVGYVPTDDEWYKQTIEKRGTLYISDIGVKDFLINAKPSIIFARQLLNQDDKTPIGVLMLDCSLDIFNDLNNEIIPNSANIYLINESGKIIFDNTSNNTGKQLDKTTFDIISKDNFGSFESDDAKVLSVFDTLPDYNWKVIANISTYELKKEYDATRNILIYITLTCIIIFIVLSIFLSSIITKPITDLSRIIRKNESHQLVPTKKHLNRMDEVGTLYTEYNNMITEINTYIKESYQNKLISLDSQMKSLEAQINSHFLYNTLETINSLADLEGIESISIISQALGDMFRYSIKTDSELVTLEAEMEHTDNYLKIQSIRYGEKLCYHYEIPDSLKNEKILKLIVQPLVENAIYHGFEEKDGEWLLQITARSEYQNIYLEVTDNGIGMSAERLSEINNLLRQAPQISELGHRNKESIGLKNVNSRIGLYYGLQYGLSIESTVNSGTKIIICIPKK